MVIFTKMKKIKLAIIIIFFFFLTILPAEAIQFKGTVVGKDDTYKKYIRVKIAGKKTFTDADGKFTVDIDEGDYTITISERNRSMEFDVKVSPTNTEKKFKLKW